MVRPLILWFGIRGAGLRFVSLLFGLMLILLLFLPPGFLNSSWQVDTGRITGADIAAWPYSVGIFIRFTSFLNTLHWPSGASDFGHFGISLLELLILFEQWAGHRLLSERLLGLMSEPTDLCYFLLFLCQRELKLGMVVSMLVAWFVLWPSYLGSG